MTNLEALKAKVGYPLSDNSLKVALSGRAITAVDTFDSTVDVSSFELAYADCLTTILSTPNSVSEGGFSVTVADRETLRNLANKIYTKYEQASPILKNNPTGTFKQIW